MRIRKKAWAQMELDTNPRIVHNPTMHKGQWNHYFDNKNPIHVEIGCGKGRFVTTMASQNLDINYLAIEREAQAIVIGARNARILQCSLGFVIGDVKNLSEILAPGEMKRLYINFCDPWPNRKKWHKRRLTHHSFLSIYQDLFQTTGEIFFKTDNQELFDFSIEQMTQQGWKLKNISRDLHNSGFKGNIMTEYEEKFSSQGMPIFRLEAFWETN